VIGLADGLRRRGHENLIVCPPSSALAGACRDRGLAVREVPMRSELDGASVVGIARALKAFRPEVAHFHTARAHTLGLAAARLAGTPVKVLSRRVDFPIGKNPFSRMKYRASVDGVIAITRAVRDILVRGGVPPDRVRVIYSGIDPRRCGSPEGGERVREELGIRPSAPLVGTVGALAPHKAQHVFLKAARKLWERAPEVRYIIAGEGELEGELKSLARRLDLEGIVTFAGFRDDIPAVFAAMDVFVLSSVAEALCTSVLDAMAAGVPVVATAVGGVPEIVERGASGLLVPPSDPEALAEAIREVLGNRSLMERLAAGGRERVEKFTLERTVRETEAFYLELIEKRGRSN